MAKSNQNVRIPMLLLTRVICLLECLEPTDCDQAIIDDHHEIALALKDLKLSIEMRNAFFQILNNSEYDSGDRREQRRKFIQRKREIDAFF